MMSIYSGKELYTMDPITFLQNPIVWPQTVQKYQINYTIGPNFSYQLACRKMREKGVQFQMPFLFQADIAAEPIHPTTPEQVISLWGVSSSSITHSYGFAEATVWVSSAPSEFDEETQVAVSGDLEWSLQLGMEIAVADKVTGTVLPEGITGDIFVQGIGMVKGYWNNPEASKAFHYKLQGKEGHWYLSGDLGYIKKGKLYLTGRSKDVIIVNGKNIYATDLERRFEEALPLILRPGCSAAFQVGDDEAVIVSECKPGQETSLKPELLLSLRKDLEREFGLKIKDLLCTKKGTVPKTTSGKVRRSETKTQFQKGAIVSNLKLSEHMVCETFEQLLKAYDIQDLEKTLLENGIDSLKLTRLIEDSQSRFGLTIDFVMAQEVPCMNLEQFALQQKSSTCPKPEIPEFPVTGERMRFFIFWQLLLVLAIVMFVSLCTIPSAYLHRYLTSSEFILKNPEVVNPWIMTFSGGPGFLLVVVPVLWMCTYTIAIILVKWILVGRYVPGRYALWSKEFAKWWFVDRLLEVWEIFVGSYFLDTPFLNLFYKSLGVQCDLASVRFSSFVREFDLVHIEKNARVKGMILSRLIDREGLLLDHIHIQEGIRLESCTVTYPGTVFSNVTQQESIPMAGTTIWEQIQRILFPFAYMCSTTAFLYFMSWVTSHCPSSRFEWEAARLLICFYGSNVLNLLLSGLLVRIQLCDFTADRLASLSDGMLGPWIRYTPLIGMLHKLLYGGGTSIFTQINGFNYVAPTKSRYLTVGAGSTISSCFITVDKENPVVLGKNCSLGLMSNIQAGVVMGDGSAVAAHSNVPKATTIESFTSYFTEKFMTTNQFKDRREWTVLDVIRPIFAKCLVFWVGMLLLISLTIFGAKWIHDILELPMVIFVPTLTLLTLVISGITLICLDIVASWLFVPDCTKGTEGKREFLATSWEGSFYINHLSFHFMFDVFIMAFIRGTVLVPWVLAMAGAQIENPSETCLFGIFCDTKNLVMKANRSDGPFYLVTDVRSYFEAHRMELGKMILEPCTSIGGVSVHPASIAMGQDVENVTIGKQTKVSFRRRVQRSTSGFFYGIPAMECEEHDSATSTRREFKVIVVDT
jgi:aryl carrier-like protein